jgi:hypothetical protein
MTQHNELSSSCTKLPRRLGLIMVAREKKMYCRTPWYRLYSRTVDCGYLAYSAVLSRDRTPCSKYL